MNLSVDITARKVNPGNVLRSQNDKNIKLSKLNEERLNLSVNEVRLQKSKNNKDELDQYSISQINASVDEV